MTDTFPVSAESLVNFLKVDSEEMRKLLKDMAEYFTRAVPFPPGFPVYLELPVIPTTKFYIKMDNFLWGLPKEVEEDPDFFKIPEGCELVEEL